MVRLLARTDAEELERLVGQRIALLGNELELRAAEEVRAGILALHVQQGVEERMVVYGGDVQATAMVLCCGCAG